MTNPGGADPHFKVTASHAILQVLRDLQRQASREGRGESFRSALKQAYDQLQSSPTTFGEPLFRLPALKLEVRTAAIRPLLVDYAVSQERKHVYLKGVKLLPGTRL